MTKLNSQFCDFLHNIEPDRRAISYAKKAHEPLREHLSKDEEFSEYFVDSFLYGSYRRHTAVGDIKDVDIVILTNFSETEKPNTVLKILKDAIARYYDDPENPEYQRRSIRVDDPLPDSDTEMTLDVIPAIVVTDELSPLKVPDREVGTWVLSHPKGHIEYTSKLNGEDYSGEKFVPLVKIFKWWWKYQCEVKQPRIKRPKPKGFWLECLAAENFIYTKDNYAEHFIALLQNIYEKYCNYTTVPELLDPGLKNKSVQTSMSISEFSKFMEYLKDSLDLAVEALNLKDDVESSKKWQKIFGPKFPLCDNKETIAPRVVRTSPPPPWSNEYFA